jgi:hypothetical protein
VKSHRGLEKYKMFSATESIEKIKIILYHWQQYLIIFEETFYGNSGEKYIGLEIS